MGSSSTSSSSSSSSNQSTTTTNTTTNNLSDAYNRTLTSSLGNQSLGVQAAGNVGNTQYSYASDSGNVSNTSSYSNNESFGASSGISSSNGTSPITGAGTAPGSLLSYLPWIGVGVVFIIIYLRSRHQ